LSAAGPGSPARWCCPDLQRLDREAVVAMLAAGIAVVGLVDPGDTSPGNDCVTSASGGCCPPTRRPVTSRPL
jgi:hypothetical protein